jgi:hypothetical protein
VASAGDSGGPRRRRRRRDAVSRRRGRIVRLTGDRGASTLVEPSWSARRARYTVRAFHVGDDGDRESSGREYTFTRDDYATYYGDDHEDPGCIAAVVRVGSRAETENGAIGIGPTYVETPCG